MSEIRVHIEGVDFGAGIRVWIFRKPALGVYEFIHYRSGETPILETYRVSESDCLPPDIPPSFVLPWGRETLAALQLALDNKGFIPESREGVRGKLEATEGWLKDMRELVFGELREKRAPRG